MAVLGLDYSYSWRNVNLDQVKILGYQFVMRYLTFSSDGKDAKRIYPVEVNSIVSHLIQLGLNWEFKQGDQLGGAPAGHNHALEAVKQAKALRYPEGCAIYFSTDFNPTLAQFSTVDAYMNAAKHVLHQNGYLIGQYGGFRVIKHTLDLKIADLGWQTYAWSGQPTVWDQRAVIRQVSNNLVVAGGAVDRNEMRGEAHLWKYC